MGLNSRLVGGRETTIATCFTAPRGDPEKTAGTESGLVREEVGGPVEDIRVWSTAMVATFAVWSGSGGQRGLAGELGGAWSLRSNCPLCSCECQA